MDIDLNRVSINQCTGSNDVFANTHRCLNTTHVSNDVILQYCHLAVEIKILLNQDKNLLTEDNDAVI